MVDTLPIQSKEHFVTLCGEQEDSTLTKSQRAELYDVWESYQDKHGDRMLVLIPDWFSQNDFQVGRRPFFFATPEYDDPDSGAMLWGDIFLVDISTVENEVFDAIDLEDAVEELDISTNEDEDHIEEAQKAWVPRSIETVFTSA